MNPGEEPLRVPVHSFSFKVGWREQEEVEIPPLDFAERRAAETETLATQAEVNGDAVQAVLWRSKAAQWRDEATIPNDAAVCMHGVAAAESIDVLLAQTTAHSELALTSLLNLSTQILQGLQTLAANGRGNAAGVLLETLTHATNEFNLLAHRRPDLFLNRTRGAFGIPSVISPFTDKKNDNAKLLEVLEVGREYPYQLPTADGGRGNQMSFLTPANLWVFRLRAHIALVQREAAKFAALTPEEQEQLVNAHPKSPTWLDDATRLKPLATESYSAWLNVMWAIVLDATDGKPEDEPVLRGLQSLPVEEEARYSHNIYKTTPAAFQKKIKEALGRGLRQSIQQNEKANRARREPQ